MTGQRLDPDGKTEADVALRTGAKRAMMRA